MIKTKYIKPSLEIVKAGSQEMMVGSLKVDGDPSGNEEGAGHGGGTDFGGIEGLAKPVGAWNNPGSLWED